MSCLRSEIDPARGTRVVWLNRMLTPYGSSDDDSDDEDETAALMAELAKIKQERAEEKARLVSLDSSGNQASHSGT